MIKGCFLSDSEFFHYPITFEGQEIAKAHSLSIIEKSKANNDMAMLILSALDSWELASKKGEILPISAANINKLNDDVLLAILTQITDHEVMLSKESKEIEKN
jgi:hypothetical protein